MTSSNYSYIITSHPRKPTVQDEQIVLRRLDTKNVSWSLPNQGNQASQSRLGSTNMAVQTQWRAFWVASQETEVNMKSRKVVITEFGLNFRSHYCHIRHCMITIYAFNLCFRSPLCLSSRVYLHYFQFKTSALKSLSSIFTRKELKQFIKFS